MRVLVLTLVVLVTGCMQWEPMREPPETLGFFGIAHVHGPSGVGLPVVPLAMTDDDEIVGMLGWNRTIFHERLTGMILPSDERVEESVPDWIKGCRAERSDLDLEQTTLRWWNRSDGLGPPVNSSAAADLPLGAIRTVVWLGDDPAADRGLILHVTRVPGLHFFAAAFTQSDLLAFRGVGPASCSDVVPISEESPWQHTYASPRFAEGDHLVLDQHSGDVWDLLTIVPDVHPGRTLYGRN